MAINCDTEAKRKLVSRPDFYILLFNELKKHGVNTEGATEK